MDIITLIIYGILIFVIFNLFISLAPILIPLILITMVINYFVRRKRVRDFEKQFKEQNQNQYTNDTYQNDQYQTFYDTRGSIKDDVIDVEYTETEEK